MKPKRTTPPRTIDEYLAPLSAETRAALQALRKTIRAVAPRAEEHISYQIPAFKLDGQWLVYFAAARNHCSLFALGETYPGELDDYDTSGKGTIRFTPQSPLPASLVRKLLKARMAKNAAKNAVKNAAKPAAKRAAKAAAKPAAKAAKPAGTKPGKPPAKVARQPANKQPTSRR
jgi:uncharacterized protein YdhG (YjbR/CyaY superfamily)